MWKRWLLPVGVALCVVSASAADRLTLVACAPGFPGTTGQAQETMDVLAEEVRRATGWPPESFAAVYHQDLAAGLKALGQDEASMALVPLPFYLAYREELGLEPLVGVQPTTGAEEQWSLVAARGVLEGPASLAGWEIAGTPGYAPDFVRRVVLGEWGELPADAEVSFTSRVLSVLRRASRGESIAAVLDGAQTAALDALPFADGLQVVFRSRPVPASVVCSVGGRLSDEKARDLSAALLSLHESESGREALAGIRVERFRSPSTEALRRASAVFAGAPN